MRHISFYGARAALATLGVALAASAWSAPLTEQHQGSASYVSGGIGDDEDTAIKAMRHAYPVSMTFTLRQDGHAEYLADVPVAIRDAKGKLVLDIKANGPYLLVRLPAGHYVVETSHHGQIKTRKFDIGDHTSETLSFEWS